MFANKTLLKTGIYRTHSAISNLQCRLTIQKIHSLIDVPVLEGLSQDQSDEQQTERGSKEARTVGWQEKVFSRYEMDYYGVKENCKTDHQKNYYNRLKAETHEPGLLFTYVQADNYYPDDPDNQNRQHVGQHVLVENNVESMYLMADLDQDVLLFSIHWFPDDGLMLVYPDFNRMSINPYYHEVRGSNLQMYHYSLETCTSTDHQRSKQPSTLTLIGAGKLMAPFPLGREERFIMPKPLHRNVLILFEIVSSTGFRYDGIHVRYRIQLPGGVKSAEGSDKLMGSTSASKHINGSWHFGHCQEIFLALPECKESQQPTIEVFFEAISIDSWQRERYAGHAYLSIPLRPQSAEATVKFVQLTHADALVDRLEAFLVGNRRKVDLTSFYGKNDSNILNRYGNETTVAGQVQVRYQTLRQHQPKVLNDGFYKAARKTKNITLRELIVSYNAARERLEEFVELKY